jgi:hypothetical protein
MLDTYMKNRGTTKTIFHDKNNNYVKKYDWDLEYDGEKANINIDENQNGKTQHYNLQLDNDDLANILKINSVKEPIDKRLLNDFSNIEHNVDLNNKEQYIDLNNFGVNNFETNLNNNQPDNYIIKINASPIIRQSQPNMSNPFLMDKPLIYQNPNPNVQFKSILDELSTQPNELLMNEIVLPKRKSRKHHKKSNKKPKVQFLTHISSPNSMENIILPDITTNTIKPSTSSYTKKNRKTHKRRKVRRVFRIPKTKL